MTGHLTLHGQTHPITLDIGRNTKTITATGQINRANWGITGSPFTGGPTIRIKVTVPNPFNTAPT
jgi:polyisoprenoid-binding protein YceI